MEGSRGVESSNSYSRNDEERLKFRPGLKMTRGGTGPYKPRQMVGEEFVAASNT